MRRILNQLIEKTRQATRTRLERITLYRALRLMRQKRAFRAWVAKGSPVPPPHIVKATALISLASRFHIKTFVETGTYQGDMLYAAQPHFEKLYSIELDEALCLRARDRFAKLPAITILLGDSGEMLGRILVEIQEPCVFWLDGHYSGGVTALGDEVSPIMHELGHITKHSFKLKHLLLIDDARLFNGRDGYPHLDVVRNYLIENGFQNISVEDDIIRVLPS